MEHVLLGAIPTGDNECRFDYKALETAIKNVIKNHLGSEDIIMSAKTNKPSCRTFVVAKMARMVTATPTLFRSYHCLGYRPIDCPIWQAARATSAAPTFFMSMHIEVPSAGADFVDGGLGFNNPSELALEESKRIWQDSKTCCLVSIGTGRPGAVRLDVHNLEKDDRSQRGALQYIQNFVPGLSSMIDVWRKVNNVPTGGVALVKMAGVLSKLATDSEKAHQKLLGAAETTPFSYYRFNVERDVGDIGLEDHTKSEDIHALTAEYLADGDVHKKEMECVRKLLPDRTFSREY